MSTEPDHDLSPAGHEPVRRSGSIVLALLAMVGLINLFPFAAGITRFADRSTDDPIIRPIADHAFDGLAVTDSRGHVVYSNAAYLVLTGAATPEDARPVERVFIGNPDV